MSGRLIPLALLTMLLAAAADAPAAEPSWRQALLLQDPAAELRVHLADGFSLQGYVLEVTADSILVAAAPGGARSAACPLAAVVKVERRGPAAARGWRTGALVGTLAGAGYAGLMAAIIESIGEGSEPPTSTEYAGLVVAGAAAGATAGGAIGALVTSGRDRWYRVARHDTGPHRGPGFGLRAGLATARSLVAEDHDGLHLGLDLAWRRGRWVEIGMETTYSATQRTVGLGGGPVAEVGPTGSLGVVARLSPPVAGLAPLVSLGTGWYRRDESWLGASFGFGLRWRTVGGTDIPLEIRWHWRASGLDPEPGNSQFTVTVGWVMPMSFR